MDNALSVINELPSTLDQVAKFVGMVKDETLSGDYNPLEVLIQLRAAKKAIDILNEDPELAEAALKEYSKYGEKVVDLKGVKVSQQESGVKYDFKACNDPEWINCREMEEAYSLNRKQRENFLKTITEPLKIIDEETGNLTVINPAPRTSKTVPVITLK